MEDINQRKAPRLRGGQPRAGGGIPQGISPQY